MGRLVITNFIVFSLLGFCVLGCTESFPLVTESFEDVLVVEATITDEFKYQEIKISRTYLLESDSQVIESNANVRIEDSNNNIYNFREAEGGVYISNIPFKPVEGVSYKLLITLVDGKEYVSSNEFLAPKAEIENLYAELVNLNGQTGVQVLVDSNDDLGEANFFRYKYEETYKIVAPFYSPFDAIVTGGITEGTIDLVAKTKEEKICYSSNISTEILLTSVNSLIENKVSKFPIRFIKADNSILRERYSILVKQYVQSVEANNFYKILKELSSEESVFVDNQPGFIQGNIFSQQSSTEKVIGFFDVSSVTSKRIYFNYSDFNIDYPAYFFDCDLRTYDYTITGPPEPNQRVFLLQLLFFYPQYKFVSGYYPEYTIVNPECGDCTTFSSNIKPTFWED
ncbi:DUF4249 domain-containing protein [Thalassobellus citreus]|uniref:DUF4249 domain-containing protein n=1 Tax=Thalassobellus citreus TaxID=3367752 RepID=UPI0037B7B3DC